jgi:DNA repair ATPase RecN
MSKSRQAIPPPSSYPAVATASANLDRLRGRLAAVEKRQDALQAELVRRESQADVKALAAKLRAGEKLDFKPPSQDGLKHEQAELRAEAEVVVEAIGQEEQVLEQARKAACLDLEKRLVPEMQALDREAAAGFVAFVAAREKRYQLAQRLIEAGYQSVAQTFMGGGVLPHLGGLAEPTSPVALFITGLVQAGLVKREDLIV